MMLIGVKLDGGPFDGLAIEWNVKKDDVIADHLLISPHLAKIRGGMTLDVTSAAACGVLRANEWEDDAIIYLWHESDGYTNTYRYAVKGGA